MDGLMAPGPGMGPGLGAAAWLVAGVAALGIGVSKSGLPGVSLLHVVLFAHLFPGLRSTGVVLPMLLVGDLGAVLLFRREARWEHVLRTLPPAVVGVASGWGCMRAWPRLDWNPVLGGIVLALALMQVARNMRPEWWARVPHGRVFAVSVGFVAGVTTMVANAAGPVMALYLLAVSLPKDAFVGTAAWFFLAINVLKLPFSAGLGLVDGGSLALNAVLAPAVVAGLFLGRWLTARIPQRGFDHLVLAFAIAASAKFLLASASLR